MPSQLRMSEEIHDWLAGLTASDPAAARHVAEALTALLEAGPGLGPPAVVPVLAPEEAADPVAALEETYQHRLEGLQALRRRVAEIATTRLRLAERITALEQAAGPSADRDQLPALRQQRGRVTEAETRLTEQSQREQRRVEAFRATKETLKARLLAAQAETRVYAALAELNAVDEDGSARDDDGGAPEEDLAASAASARERVKEIEAEIRQTLSDAGRDGQDVEPGLMVLRAGPSGEGEIRLLFAAEPPGTVLLIAVLEGREAWQDHRDEARSLSSRVLRLVRAGQAPEAVARHYDGPRAFLAEFFPGQPGPLG